MPRSGEKALGERQREWRLFFTAVEAVLGERFLRRRLAYSGRIFEALAVSAGCALPGRAIAARGR